MVQFGRAFGRGERNNPCLCRLGSGSTDSAPQRVLTESLEPLCRECCRTLALALMEMAEERPESWPPSWRIM